MKRVYLVRHGETDSNLKRTWRTANESLTDTGVAQAHLVGRRMATLPIDRLVASTAARTLATAEVISEHIGVSVEGEALFYEEKAPTSIQGLLHKKSPDNPIEQYIQALLDHAEDPDYHYEDEENLHDRKVRAAAMYDFLLNAPEDNLLVVTHGNIQKMLAAYITLGSDCTAKELYLSSQRFKTDNTGITELILAEDGFRILHWNDVAHFAE